MKLRQVKIVNDVLNVFLEPEVININLKIWLEKKVKQLWTVMVCQEKYSALWENFLEPYKGEYYQIPRLKSDYSEKEWQAVGRIWLKDTWTKTSHQSDCNLLLFLPVVKGSPMRRTYSTSFQELSHTACSLKTIYRLPF